MKYIRSIIWSSCMLLAVVLQSSCMSEENYSENTITEKTTSLRMDINSKSFDGVGSRSSNDWKEGDFVFIKADNLEGYAKYTNGAWTLTYKGKIENGQTCMLQHSSDPITQDANGAELSYESSVYEGEGTLTERGEEVILKGALSPKCARFRFFSSNSTNLTVSGMCVPQKYQFSIGKFQTTISGDVELKISSSYSPYIYIVNDGSNQELTLKVNGCIFTRSLTNDQMNDGASGYFEIPTKDNPNNWTYVSEIPIEPWDGTVATSFAGGSGTFADPYLIETGGQLALIAKYPHKKFVLKNNINLDNKKWKPIEFRGELDGGGFTISNLYIDRDEENLGLFSKTTGITVKNLAIRGVKIKSANNHVGALVGYMYDTSASKSQIENVHIVLTDNSIISGNEYVGGIIGEFHGSDSKLSNCSVTTTDGLSNYMIIGNRDVGGIAGWKSAPVSNCNVEVSIMGEAGVSGIASGDDCEKCSYTGKLYCSKSVCGGISGVASNVIACKVNAEIIGNDAVGGICYDSSQIIACYSHGKIFGTTDVDAIGNSRIWSTQERTFLSYSTMVSEDDKLSKIKGEDCATTQPNASGRNTVANCMNITDHLRSACSDYASYWNFNNTWNWNGEINGSKVSVSCPKLSWEK